MNKIIVLVLTFSQGAFGIFLDQKSPNFEKQVLGCVLGTAIGSSLARPVGMFGYDKVKKIYPSGVHSFYDLEDSDFKTSKWGNQLFAPYSGNMQLGLELMRALDEDKLNLDSTMEGAAVRFADWSESEDGGKAVYRNPNKVCLRSCRRLRNKIKNNKIRASWWAGGSGAFAGMNGENDIAPATRVWPVGLMFSGHLKEGELYAVAQSKLTHRHKSALATSAAMATGVCSILDEKPLNDVCADMISIAAKYDTETADLMARVVEATLQTKNDMHLLDELKEKKAAGALGAAMYIFLKHSNDFKRAISAAVNAPGDCEGIAMLVGTLVGTNVGLDGLPKDWFVFVENSETLVIDSTRKLIRPRDPMNVMFKQMIN